jgi:uncharacterized membrane protein
MIAASLYMIVFRIVHIGAGVAWAGSVFFLVAFVQPAAAAVGPAGAPFMAELLGVRRLVDRIIGIAWVSVVGGLFLYWRDWDLFGSLGDWLGSSFGAVLTIGALAAIGALAVGIFATRPTVARLLALGRSAAEAGGPTAETAASIARAQERLRALARGQLVMISIAVIAMATARYW